MLWNTIAAATLAPAAAPIERAPVDSALQTLRQLVRSAIRQIAIGVLGGMLVGFLVLGGGLRLMMRVSAMLSDTGGNRVLTENGNVVGEITLGGTLSLMLFVGLTFGAMGGVIVMAVRPWLPAGGWSRYLLAGAIGFAVASPAVLQRGDNPDYKRFGILGLNICLFTILPFLFGIAVLPVLDTLDRRISKTLPGGFFKGADTIKSIALIFFALPILIILPAAIGSPPVGLLLALPVVRVIADVWSRHAKTRALQRRRETWGLYAGRVALAIPALIGLLLTAQAIGRLTS